MSENGNRGRPASSFERAEELLGRAEDRLMPVLARLVSQAVEAAEDIWAEAQALRRERQESGR